MWSIKDLDFIICILCVMDNWPRHINFKSILHLTCKLYSKATSVDVEKKLESYSTHMLLLLAPFFRSTGHHMQSGDSPGNTKWFRSVVTPDRDGGIVYRAPMGQHAMLQPRAEHTLISPGYRAFISAVWTTPIAPRMHRHDWLWSCYQVVF